MEPIVNQQAGGMGSADPNAQNLDGQMSSADQAYVSQLQAPGQPVTQADQVPSEAPAGNYITKQDLEAILSQRESDIVRRASQSATDRVSARVNERLNAIEMNKAALGLSDEQMKQAKQNIIQEELTNTAPAQAQNQASDLAPSPQEEEILGIMDEIFRGEGIEVLASDPEGKIIQDAIMDPNTTPYKIRKAVMDATMRKNQRLQMKTNGMQAPPAGGPAAKNSNSMSTTQLWDTAYKK